MEGVLMKRLMALLACALFLSSCQVYVGLVDANKGEREREDTLLFARHLTLARACEGIKEAPDCLMLLRQEEEIALAKAEAIRKKVTE